MQSSEFNCEVIRLLFYEYLSLFCYPWWVPLNLVQFVSSNEGRVSVIDTSIKSEFICC